jgi:hypothetical protein
MADQVNNHQKEPYEQSLDDKKKTEAQEIT